VPYLLKILVTLILVVAITEATKRFGFVGAMLAALPIISVISMVWIYLDTGNTQKVALFSIQVFWFVLPSLGMFLSLPSLLQRFSFVPSLLLAILITLFMYLVMLGGFRLLNYRIGI